MRSNRLAVRAFGFLTAALLAAGCSSGSGTGPSRDSPAPVVPLPASPGVLGATSPSDVLPKPSGEVVHGSVPKDGGYRYTAQLVGETHRTAALPGEPVPAGKTAVLFRLKLAADPVDRSSMAPPELLVGIQGSWCGKAGDTCSIWANGASRLVVESSVRAGNHRDSVLIGDVMDANTVYYRYYWQFVPETADLSDARLCFNQGDGKEACTPLGPVTPLIGKLPDGELA
ncbi:hypothetical protein AB0I39_30380 [Kitasatospora purpeofusca]|uniref:hypothetical protein n=1 Tax=Kitasatospora purpeofusca TaxID=67352 RepID=UPI0033D805B8